MKYEWKKSEKQFYAPGASPELVTVPRHRYVMVKGSGDPNGAAFSQTVELLYAVSYGIRMMPKGGYTPPGYMEYTVFPLEGVWDLAEAPEGGPIKKDELIYEAMIRQPEFVTQEVFLRALETAKGKKKGLSFEKVEFITQEDGLSVQMLHLGPYDNESTSFDKMKAFCQSQGLRRTGHTHREIYLGDPRKAAPEKLRTVLRYQVEKE